MNATTSISPTKTIQVNVPKSSHLLDAMASMTEAIREEMNFITADSLKKESILEKFVHTIEKKGLDSILNSLWFLCKNDIP